jgi:hypothetical protein
MTSQHGAYALHAGLSTLHAHTHAEIILIAFSREQGFANALNFMLLRTLSALLT